MSYVDDIEGKLGRKLEKDEAMAVVAALYLDQKNVLLEAARFALSVIKANHPCEASEFLAIDNLERAIESATRYDVPVRKVARASKQMN